MKRVLEWFRPVERVELTESELQRGLREEREWARRLADVSRRGLMSFWRVIAVRDLRLIMLGASFALFVATALGVCLG